jgi:hypothetical protein
MVLGYGSNPLDAAARASVHSCWIRGENMKALMILLLSSAPVIAQSASTDAISDAIKKMTTTYTCSWQTDRQTGHNTFSGGCDAETMKRADEIAMRERPVNAGDLAELNKKLDQIINLLKAR